MWFHSRLPKSKRRVVGMKPTLEILEDRMAPATFTVTTKLDVVDAADGRLSVREAVTKANNQAGPDTIVLPAGVYKMTLPGLESFNAAGDFNIVDSVTFKGAGAASTVVDGGLTDRVFDIFGTGPSSIRVMFQGLKIRNGNTDVIFGGGGILVGNADLVVRDCVISANRTSGVGAGISNGYVPGTGRVTLIRSTVSGNVAGGDGAGLYVKDSTLTLTNSK